MPRTVFVTGAAGFIGSHVSEALLARGDRVFGFDNFDPFYDRRIKERNLAALSAHPSFSFLEGDIRDASALARWGEGIRSRRADPPGREGRGAPVGRRSRRYADVNVHGTIRMLEWARERKVPKVLFASSSSVYGGNTKVPFSEDDFVDHPVSPYAATKKAGELLCHTYCHLYGMNVAALRFFTVYGPRQRPEMAIHKFTRRILDGKEIDLYGDGSSRRDYTYIEDIVSGVLGALTAPPGYRVYNLGEAATISLSDLVAADRGGVREGRGAALQAAAARGRSRDVRGHLPREEGDRLRPAHADRARRMPFSSNGTGVRKPQDLPERRLP